MQRTSPGFRIVGSLLVVCAVLAVGCTRQATTEYIAVPTTRKLQARPSTTRNIAAVQQKIDGVGGSSTSTTLSFAKGDVVISGTVRGPEGPVQGATVVLTRILGEQRAVLRVSTNSEGKYLAPNIKGGVVELFAFKAPSLSAGDGKVFFASGRVSQDIELQSFSDTEIRWSIGPGQPTVGRPISVSLQVTVRRVDPDGIVRSEPLEGISARIVALGTLVPTGDTELLTNAAGLVSFPMSCSGTGSAALQVFFATGEETSLEPRGCQLPATTAPKDSVPPDSGDLTVTTIEIPLGPGETRAPTVPTSRRRRTTTVVQPAATQLPATQPPATQPPAPTEPPATVPIPPVATAVVPPVPVAPAA